MTTAHWQDLPPAEKRKRRRKIVRLTLALVARVPESERGPMAEVLAELAACAAVDLVRTGAVSATEE